MTRFMFHKVHLLRPELEDRMKVVRLLREC